MKIIRMMISLLALMVVSGCASGNPQLPETLQKTRTGQQTFDENNPPALAELNFQSHGKRLNGHLYIADGPGPHPTVVLLHGFPGNEKNLDLAQALRTEGYNILFFHYRGAWGSEGIFSFNHAIEDVASAINMLRIRSDNYRVDVDRISIIGHSMGGFAALQAAARDETITCVAGIAAVDLGARAEILMSSPEAVDGFAKYAGSLQMLSGLTGKNAVQEILTNADSFNLQKLASKLKGKSVLLVAGDRDKAVPPKINHKPIAIAYKTESSIRLEEIILSGDHSFSWSRDHLIEVVTNWIESCEVDL